MGIEYDRPFLQKPSEETLHPILRDRARLAQYILDDAESLTIPEYVPPSLHPHAADQPISLTPFDEFDSMKIAIPPDESIKGWEILYKNNLELANSPSRIEAMMAVEERGFTPPPKLPNGAIDKAVDEGIILELPDLGHLRQLSNFGENETYLTRIAELIRESKNGILAPALLQEIEKFATEQESIKQAHRTDLLATGPFSFSGKYVGSFVGLGAMPSIGGSVLALETAAKMYMTAHVPEVGYFSDITKQAALAGAVLERLNGNDPLLGGRDPREKDFMLKHWRSYITGVLEVNPKKALKRAGKLAEVGVTSFRIYGHTHGGDILTTLRLLRNEYPDANINASQISSIEMALACEYYGANSITAGVGGGGACLTGQRSDYLPENAVLAWKLRGLLGIPLLCEGGGIDNPVNAILVGFSGVNGSGSIGGGTFEAPGGVFFFTKDGRKFLKRYAGEASDSTKWESGRTYSTGTSYFQEGSQSFKELKPVRESMTENILKHWERIILGAVVLGVDDGPFTISAMQNINPSPLFRKSQSGTLVQGLHTLY